MPITKEQLYELIDAEIAWCEGEKSRRMPIDWHNGFINGLKSARQLIENLKS